MPGATVAASCHGSARSSPLLQARTIGAQPSDCTTYIRGRSLPISPIACSSPNAFHIPIRPVPPPVG